MVSNLKIFISYVHYAHHVNTWYPLTSKEGVGSPESGVKDSCKLPSGLLGRKPGFTATTVSSLSCWVVSPA